MADPERDKVNAVSKGLMLVSSAVMTILPSDSSYVVLSPFVEKLTDVFSLSTIVNEIEFWLLFILAFPTLTFDAVRIIVSAGSSSVSADSLIVKEPLDEPSEIVIVAALKVKSVFSDAVPVAATSKVISPEAVTLLSNSTRT